MEEKKCNSCGKKLSFTEIRAAIIGFYLLGTSIYGTIELIKKLISLLTSSSVIIELSIDTNTLLVNCFASS